MFQHKRLFPHMASLRTKTLHNLPPITMVCSFPVVVCVLFRHLLTFIASVCFLAHLFAKTEQPITVFSLNTLCKRKSHQQEYTRTKSGDTKQKVGAHQPPDAGRRWVGNLEVPNQVNRTSAGWVPHTWRTNWWMTARRPPLSIFWTTDINVNIKSYLKW